MSTSWALALLLVSVPLGTPTQATGAPDSCPRVLMFDGVDISTQNGPEHAAYWGRLVGIDGFFLNHMMSMWQTDVGTDPESPMWKQSAAFQRLYAANGVTDNFIKVAIWKPHDWGDQASNAQVALNFSHAAALARFAGFKGMALDLEAYVPIWGDKRDVAAAVYSEGRAIGEAMHASYPSMSLVLIQDAVHWAAADKGYNGGYALSQQFLNGLLSVHFDDVVFATELTYERLDANAVVEQLRREYRDYLSAHALNIRFDIAPGLWPLGHSYVDKSQRLDPPTFERSFQTALHSVSKYVWIYGFGSAWQADGPYGKGPVAKDFPLYTATLRSHRTGCAARAHAPQ